MKIKKVGIIFTFALIMMGLFILGNVNYQASANGIGYSVQPIFPKNQVKNQGSYFDLKTNPDQSYLLKVKVNNSTDHDINVHTNANPALTDDNANIDYNRSSYNKLDASMHYPFNKLVTNKNTNILIHAHHSIISQFDVKTPVQKFNGMILGSLVFTEVPPANHNKQPNKVNINNSYSYVYPVVLNSNKIRKVQPHLKLLSAGGKLINGTDNFYGHFQNDQPNLMTSVKMLGEIYSQRGYDHHAKPLYLQANNNASIAPNTNFNYLIDTNGQGFKAGQYVFVGTAKWGKRHFRFVKHFRLHFKQTYEDNHKATGVHNNDNWILWLLLILLLVILIITFVVLYIRNRRKNKRFRMYYLKHHK